MEDITYVIICCEQAKLESFGYSKLRYRIFKVALKYILYFDFTKIDIFKVLSLKAIVFHDNPYG